MNFFERQDSARASSKRLIFFFICGVLATALLIHIVVSCGLYYLSGGADLTESARHMGNELVDEEYSFFGSDDELIGETSNGGVLAFGSFFFDPTLFTLDLLIVSAIIGLGSLFKISELNRLGAEGIALSLGGTPVTNATTNPRARRLYNVVEEIAAASGSPLPRVFILDQETGINACAIGTSPESAAVCVTRGALDVLSRDELQGVVAHEFSHIVNNDVKLNTRLIGVLFGLELIAMIAMAILRVFQFSSFSSSSRSNDNSKRGGAIILALILVCLAIFIIGSAGVFFGGLIRAAISRRREYLADSSAVQFTRNPSGIAGALKKIGALGAGSKLVSKNAYGASHMFFSNVFSGNFLQSLIQTHPPLVDRIRAIEPDFDGRFPKTIQVNDWGESNVERANPQIRSSFHGVAAGFTSGVNLPHHTPETRESVDVKTNGGSVDAFQYLKGVEADFEFDESVDLTSLADDASSSRALIFALLLDKDSNVRARQLAIVKRNCDSSTIAKLNEFQDLFRNSSDLARINAANKIRTRLKTLNRDDYETFRSTVLELCGADGRLDLFEYAVQASVIRELDVRFGKSRGVQTRFGSFEEIREPCLSALAYLAYEKRASTEEIQKAFRRGCAAFVGGADFALPRAETSLGDFTRALNLLSQASCSLKRDAVKAFCLCATYDGRIDEREAFLLEICGASLGTGTPDWRMLKRKG